MASPPQAISIDLSDLQQEIISDYVVAASSTLFIYDWLVSFDQEVQHIWDRKWTLSTWIFVVNRYATLVDMIIMFIPNPNNRPGCVALIRLDNVLELLFITVSALFTGLRVYALCNQNTWAFLLVFALGMVSFFTNMIAFIAETVIFVPGVPNPICHQHLPYSFAVELRISLSTRIALIIADVIVLAVTWRKAASTVREASRINVRVPLSEVLIRDGTFFFLGLLAINVYQILHSNIDAVASAFPISGLLQPLGSIIISRFILNLRQANQPSEDTSDTVGWSTSRFNSHIFVGNLGESLVFGDTDDSDDSDAVTISARQDSPSIESYQHRDNDIDSVRVRMS